MVTNCLVQSTERLRYFLKWCKLLQAPDGVTRYLNEGELAGGHMRLDSCVDGSAITRADGPAGYLSCTSQHPTANYLGTP